MTLQAQIQSLETQMRETVLQAARERGTIRMHVPHADNYWTVTVDYQGNTRYDGYAEEARGRWGTVADLRLSELAQLLEACKDR